MTLKELADKLEALDEDAFVSLLQLEYTHDDEPGQVKSDDDRRTPLCRGSQTKIGAASVGRG
jgi:hypothetical protein